MKKRFKFNIKCRNRSKKELLIRKKEFLKICDILKYLNIRYFLQTGILLGAIRHKNFIPWDWDVELSVFSLDLENKLLILESRLKKSNFNILQIDNKLESLKIDFYGKLPFETTGYTIFGWNHDIGKKIFWRKKFKVPDHFFLNMKKIKLFNKYHYAPYPPEKYLEFQYGNWKKPIQSSNKLLYLREEFSGKNKMTNFFEAIFIIIKKFILGLIR